MRRPYLDELLQDTCALWIIMQNVSDADGQVDSLSKVLPDFHFNLLLWQQGCCKMSRSHRYYQPADDSASSTKQLRTEDYESA